MGLKSSFETVKCRGQEPEAQVVDHSKLEDQQLKNVSQNRVDVLRGDTSSNVRRVEFASVRV